MIDDTEAPMEPQDAPPEDSQGSAPDGGDPSQAIGYIPDEYPAKEKTYLLAAKKVILNEQTAKVIRQLLSSSNDAATALAAFIGKTVDAIETKLGPLTDEEHDRVCLVIAGWLASSLQAMGMPGMDSPEGRQDLMGRVLKRLDSMTQGQGQEGAGEPPAGQREPEPGAQPQGAAPPMDQFGG